MAKVPNLSDKEIFNRILESSYRYRDNLLGKNLIIISYNRKENKYSYIECEFLAKHFQHLTGVKIRPSKGAPTFNPDIGSAQNFFSACIDHKLKMTDYRLPDDGTVQMKMVVIKEVMNFIYSKNMMGSFSGPTDKLVTEKLVGNVRGSLGFVNDKDKPGSGIKVPNTVLNFDIRKHTHEANSIVCIFEKRIEEDRYNIVRYVKPDKAKKKGGKIIQQPIDFLKAVKKLDIVKDKVDQSLFD